MGLVTFMSQFDGRCSRSPKSLIFKAPNSTATIMGERVTDHQAYNLLFIPSHNITSKYKEKCCAHGYQPRAQYVKGDM